MAWRCGQGQVHSKASSLSFRVRLSQLPLRSLLGFLSRVLQSRQLRAPISLTLTSSVLVISPYHQPSITRPQTEQLPNAATTRLLSERYALLQVSRAKPSGSLSPTTCSRRPTRRLRCHSATQRAPRSRRLQLRRLL